MCSSLRLTLAVVLTALLGCGLKLGEPAPKAAPPTFQGDQYSCVGEIPEKLDLYFQDQLNDEQINGFISCLQRSFLTFVQLTRGRDQTVYRPEEIRDFLQERFLNKRQITDRFLAQVMLIKVAMVGGRTDQITRRELHAFIDILEDVRREALRLRPHLQVLNPRLALTQDPLTLGERLTAAGQVLHQSILVFAGRFQSGHEAYTFEHMNELVSEFRAFVNWRDHFPQGHPVEYWVDFIRNFKILMVSDVDSKAIRANEWEPLIRRLSSWYLAFLQYEVGVRRRPLLYGEGLLNLDYLASEVFRLTLEALRPNRTWRIEQMVDMLISMQRLGWLPGHIRRESFQATLKAVLGRMYGDPRIRPSERGVKGLDERVLSRINDDFKGWSKIQLQLDSMYQVSPLVLRDRVPRLQRPVPYLAPGQPMDPDWNEFIKIKTLMGHRPLFPEHKDRVFMVAPEQYGAHKMTFGFYNLSLMNTLRSIVMMIFRGYAEDGMAPQAWQTGIKTADFQLFYRDFREMGIDLGLVDKRNCNSGERAFAEGNLFTFNADGVPADADKSGGGQLTFVEAMELFAFLYSGGMTSYEFYEEFASFCELGPKDLNGKPMLSRGCVFTHLPEMMRRRLTNMPGLQAYMAAHPGRESLLLAWNVLQTAFSNQSHEEWVEFSELSTVTVILHYAEALMTRFDLDQNGKLDRQEIERAMPVFTGFLRNFVAQKHLYFKEMSQREAENAFLYILKHNQIPGVTAIRDIWLGVSWRPEDDVDRLKLSRVLRLIISRIMSSGQNTTPSTCPQ